MTQSPRLATPLPVGNAVPAGSLRADLERRRAANQRHSIREAVGVIVPLCTEISALHARGQHLFVHPSSIAIEVNGRASMAVASASAPPVLPRDRACLAPEERSGKPGDARASVYAIGAILYEMITGEAVGPGMRRPSEVVRGLDPAVEAVLGKALVGDPAHRPDDLGALAQALHHLAPQASEAPPPADESALDGSGQFDVDVSLSMLPPPPMAPVARPAPPVIDRDAPPMSQAPVSLARPSQLDPTARLADLKVRLESDVRPRYVVVKDGMDHGPFSAVELLQQIGSHQFEEDHVLRDAISKDERPIKDWEEFAPFAEQAKLNREIVAEKKELERVVVAETKSTRRTFWVAVGVLGGLTAIVVTYLLISRGQRDDKFVVATDDGVSVDSVGDIKGQKKKRPAGGGGGGVAPAGGGNYPTISGGKSCEAAQAEYVQEMNIGGPKGPADLTAGQFGAVLNNGSYVVACGAPQSMHVNVCAAVQNGRAVGVSVSTDPPNAGIAGCIAGRVRGMSFPVSPRLDVTRTQF